jgi:ATPase family associated with various cellular activities (AAA)
MPESKNEPQTADGHPLGWTDRAVGDWIWDSDGDDDDDALDCEMGIWNDDRPYVAKGSRPLWSEVEAGVYSHFYSSGAKLPAGTYRCVVRHGNGICLQKVESQSDEVVLLPDPVAENLIREAQRFWLAAKDFRALGFLHKRGFLLMGPAGCGKTCIINQVAEYVLQELDGLVLLVTNPAHAESVLSNLRRVEPERRVLAVIEDIDAMLGDGREERLLSLLDGKTQIDHVLFIATTNYPERLDQRLQARPSRFDRAEVIRAPSAQVRRAYLEKRLPDLPTAELESWIELSEEFSIAHLKELILAVRCLGADVSETAGRLRSGLKPRHTSENFRRSRLGFSRGGR